MGVKVREIQGIWRLVVDIKGRRVSRNVGPGKAGQRAARLAAVQIQARLAHGDWSVLDPPTPAAPVPAPVQVQDIAAEWLRSHQAVRGIRHNTFVNYETALRNHVLPWFGATEVRALDVPAVEAFIAAKLQPGGSTRYPGRPLSRGTLRVSLNVLRVLCGWAINRKLLDANPVAAIRFTRTSADDLPVDPFTTAELRALLHAAETRDQELAALLRVWIGTGMRAGEVVGLQWHDLDLDAGTVLVRRTFSRGRLGPTKTGGPRSVSLGHPVGIETSEWRPGAHHETRTVVDGLRRLPVRALVPEAFVFGGGQTPIRADQLNRRWRVVVTTARVRYRPPEQLRHTLAGTLLSRNAPLLYVQRQGGWKSAGVCYATTAAGSPRTPASRRPPARPPERPPSPGTHCPSEGRCRHERPVARLTPPHFPRCLPMPPGFPCAHHAETSFPPLPRRLRCRLAPSVRDLCGNPSRRTRNGARSGPCRTSRPVRYVPRRRPLGAWSAATPWPAAPSRCSWWRPS